MTHTRNTYKYVQSLGPSMVADLARKSGKKSINRRNTIIIIILSLSSTNIVIQCISAFLWPVYRKDSRLVMHCIASILYSQEYVYDNMALVL